MLGVPDIGVFSDEDLADDILEFLNSILLFYGMVWDASEDPLL